MAAHLHAFDLWKKLFINKFRACTPLGATLLIIKLPINAFIAIQWQECSCKIYIKSMSPICNPQNSASVSRRQSYLRISKLT